MNGMRTVVAIALLGLLHMPGVAARADDRFSGLPDPTRPSYASVGGEEQPGSVHGLRLQSILIGPHRSAAVINGKPVSVGERVGDATVAAIRADAVVLRRSSGEFTLRLVPRYVSRSSSTRTSNESNSHGSPR